MVVPLGQVAEVRETLGPAQINHLDRDKVVNVQANVQGRSLSEVLRDIRTRPQNVRLPQGYKITEGGEAADQTEVFGRIFTALIVAVLLMYLILVVQFGSFLDPLAILISLPLSLIGVVLALLVTRDTLNIMSLIGVILLMGIVAKNAILLIDFAKWSHERRGLPLRDALIEAGRIRLRPIIMTTLALIAGMVPVALGRRRRRRLPCAAGTRGHRRRHHLHAAHAAGDSDGVRDPLGCAELDPREVPALVRARQGRAGARRRRAAASASGPAGVRADSGSMLPAAGGGVTRGSSDGQRVAPVHQPGRERTDVGGVRIVAFTSRLSVRSVAPDQGHACPELIVVLAVPWIPGERFECLDGDEGA